MATTTTLTGMGWLSCASARRDMPKTARIRARRAVGRSTSRSYQQLGHAPMPAGSAAIPVRSGFLCKDLTSPASRLTAGFRQSHGRPERGRGTMPGRRSGQLEFQPCVTKKTKSRTSRSCPCTATSSVTRPGAVWWITYGPCSRRTTPASCWTSPTSATWTARGLGELIECYRAADSRGAAVKLLGVNGRLSDLLVITKLVNVFERFDTREAAIASFAPLAVAC